MEEKLSFIRRRSREGPKIASLYSQKIMPGKESPGF